ncbi:MAG: ribosome small subunit-dependent GTPase A, partial [Nanoarchaeota archaeon]|nr:ribosome small subunit-dependent GTPase A [Nanoarchaeota archaeon]
FVERIDDKDKAIVIEKNHGIFKVFYNDEIISGVKLSRTAKYFGAIVPGDYVSLAKDNFGYCISSIQRRASKISRMKQDRTGRGAEYAHIIAANIDAVIAVVSARSPPLHINAIDRYIVMIQSNNIEPIICLNKADLAEGYEDGLLKEYAGIKYVKTSTRKKEGIEELKKIISGKTVVFIGQSGVGKSSLINAVSGDIIAREGEVSKKTDRGKHTTTASTVYKWKENSYIIDTPGIRSFGIGNIPKNELQLYFPEFKAYQCRYGNCLHNKEDARDCGVKRALAEGKIPKKRYDSYVRLLEE